MADTASTNKWDRLSNPPPPLFLNTKEKDFVKQVNMEFLERIVSHQITYYAIDLEKTNFHPLYGEAINKTFLPPLVISTLVEWKPTETTTTTTYGTDDDFDIVIHFHRRRLTEDQNLQTRVGDFVGYDGNFYEIVTLVEPRLLFGQAEAKFEITALCKKARRGVFTAD